MDETLAERIVQTDNLTTVRRFLIGVLLASAIPFGVPALLVAGTVGMAINSFAANTERGTQQKRLLNFYKDEVAALQGKSADSLTLDDLKQVAAPVEKGGKGISAIQKELDDYDIHRKFQRGFGAVSSAITTGLMVGLSFAFPGFLEGGMALMLGLGLTGLGHNLVAQGVRAVGQAIYGGHEHKLENGVHQRLMRIAEEIKEKPVNATEIFSLYAQATPELSAEIKKKYGSSYDHLTIMQKQQVSAAYEGKFRVAAVTDAINEGQIKPSLLGFVLCGSSNDALPGMNRFKELMTRPLEPQPQAEPAQAKEPHHAERVKQEREQRPTTFTLH